MKLPFVEFFFWGFVERGHCPGDEVKATEGVTNLLICFLN